MPTFVSTDPGFESQREVAAAEGFRAVQSTPLTDQSGRMLGMVSTHFRGPHRPPGRDLLIMALYGDLAGAAIARHLEGARDRQDANVPESQPDDGLARRKAHPSEQDAWLIEFTHFIVNRLFSVGLSLESARGILRGGAAADRIAAAAEELDRTISDIRTTVFQRTRPGAAGG